MSTRDERGDRDADDSEGRVRASDTERDRIVAELQRHYLAGRITIREFEERLDRVFATTTLADLSAVTRDLPAPRSGSRFRRAATRRQKARSRQASTRRRQLSRKTVNHLVALTVVTVFLAGLWFVLGVGVFWWSIWVMGTWAYLIVQMALRDLGIDWNLGCCNHARHRNRARDTM